MMIIPTEIYEKVVYFLPRLLFAGLSWGDVVEALHVQGKTICWQRWAEAWDGLGNRYLNEALVAEKEGRLQTSEGFLKTAAAAYHFGEFMLFDNAPMKVNMRRKVTETFRKRIPYLDFHVDEIVLPIESFSAPAFFMRPSSGPSRQAVILLNGLDSAKEVELTSFAEAFLKRGISCLVFDGPGQGLSLGNESLNPSTITSLVEKAIEELVHRKFQDIGLFGVSFGGFLALSAASEISSPYLKGVINLSGGINLDHFDKLSERLKHDFRFAFLSHDNVSMKAEALDKITISKEKTIPYPLLSIHGSGDRIFPIDHLRDIDRMASIHTKWVFEGEAHVAQNKFSYYIPKMSDWMLTVLKEGASR